MIRKMKKLSLFVFVDDKVHTLDKLASLGVVHIETEKGATSSEIEAINQEKTRCLKAKSILKTLKSTYEKEKKALPKIISGVSKYEDVVSDILKFNENIDKLKSEEDILKKELLVVKPFGDFNFEKLLKVKDEANLSISFHLAPSKEFKNIDYSKFEGVVFYQIKEDAGRVYFVAIREKSLTTQIPFENITLPAKSLSTLQTEIKNIESKIVENEEAILKLYGFFGNFDNALSKFEMDNNFAEALVSFKEGKNTDGKILFVNAYVPLEKENTVRMFLNDNHIAYILTEPAQGDNVPVDLKNNKYSGSYELITRLFQLPSYFELDLTPMIAVFYPIFFAFCFGDSGYGIVIMIVALIGFFTFLKGKMFNVGVIAMTLGIVTTIMGIINGGVIFGVSFKDLQHIPLFVELSRYTIITDSKEGWFFTPFNTALLCGLFQIFFALILNLVNRIRNKDIGDIFNALGKLFLIPGLVLWFLGDMQKMYVIRSIFNPYYYFFMLFGVICLVVLSNIGKKPNVLDAILGVYFATTGIMGDTLSYIRLFALGASSSILGLVVNQIAVSFKAIPVVGVVIMVAFLIVGHIGNFALSILGSLVHPLRLTFVEFYNNVGFTGGGRDYKPLRKEI